MKIGDHDWHLDTLGKHIWRGRMESGQLLALAREVKEEGGQLIALWGSDDRHLDGVFGIHAALLTSAGTCLGELYAAGGCSGLPRYCPYFPAGRSHAARDF